MKAEKFIGLNLTVYCVAQVTPSDPHRVVSPIIPVLDIVNLHLCES